MIGLKQRDVEKIGCCIKCRSRIVLFSLQLLVVVSFAFGCAAGTVRLNEGVREYVAADYPSVLKTWTRTGRLIVIDEADELLTVTSTFESYDFRWAYVVRYAQDYRLTVDGRRDLLRRTLEETHRHHQFYVALYGAKWRWTDLTKPESAWVVRLIDDLGNETAPMEIVSINRPGALEVTYFPYTTPWRRVFRIRFPITRGAQTDAGGGRPTISPKAKWFGLRFAGAQGSMELHWNISGGG